MIEKSLSFFHLFNKNAVLPQSGALSRGHFPREVCPKEETLGWCLENRNWSPCLSLTSQREGALLAPLSLSFHVCQWGNKSQSLAKCLFIKQFTGLEPFYYGTETDMQYSIKDLGWEGS